MPLKSYYVFVSYILLIFFVFVIWRYESTRIIPMLELTLYNLSQPQKVHAYAAAVDQPNIVWCVFQIFLALSTPVIQCTQTGRFTREKYLSNKHTLSAGFRISWLVICRAPHVRASVAQGLFSAGTRRCRYSPKKGSLRWQVVNLVPPERVKACEDGPLRLKVLPLELGHTRPDPCTRKTRTNKVPFIFA